MVYLLDTNIVSDLVRNPQGKAAARVKSVGDERIVTRIVVAAELRYGIARKKSRKLATQLELVLGDIEILPLDIPSDETYGGIRARLEAAGTVIGHNDLLIAAHAMTLGHTLVTDNVDEFSRVAGLKIENWLR